MKTVKTDFMWFKKTKKPFLLVPFQIHLSRWTDPYHVLKRPGLVIFPLYRWSQISIASGSQPLNLAPQISMSKINRYSWLNAAVFPHMMKCCVEYCVLSLWGCIYHLICLEAKLQLLRQWNFPTTSTLFDWVLTTPAGPPVFRCRKVLRFARGFNDNIMWLSGLGLVVYLWAMCVCYCVKLMNT